MFLCLWNAKKSLDTCNKCKIINQTCKLLPLIHLGMHLINTFAGFIVSLFFLLKVHETSHDDTMQCICKIIKLIFLKYKINNFVISYVHMK